MKNWLPLKFLSRSRLEHEELANGLRGPHAKNCIKNIDSELCDCGTEEVEQEKLRDLNEEAELCEESL